MSIWKIADDISSGKKNILDEIGESEYNAWIINRHFSYFVDTVAHAEAMNRKSDLPFRLQHDYLLNAIRPRKRFTKWTKKENIENIEVVQEYFQYNTRKAKEALKILTPEQIKAIKTKVYTGGTSK